VFRHASGEQEARPSNRPGFRMKGPVSAGLCASRLHGGRLAVLSAPRRRNQSGPLARLVSGQIVLSEAESGERSRPVGLLNSACRCVGLQPGGRRLQVGLGPVAAGQFERPSRR